MDEISPFGDTEVIEILGGETSDWTIDPKRYGFGGGDVADIGGGPPAENAATILRVLSGEGNSASVAAVVLNAAAALYVGGAAPSFDDAVVLAKDATESGVGVQALERLRTAFS